MVTEFATLGSCSSRNIFYSRINENYKSYFSINKSIEFVNMISLMSNPVEFDKESFLSESAYDGYVVEDFEKTYLNFLKEDKIIEYLILDTFCDVEFNVLVVGENQFVTESTRLRKTELYNSVKDNDRVDIHKDFNKYFDLWKKSYDNFFKFMNENRPDINIILNCSRLVYRYLEGDKIAERSSFKKRSNDNKFRNILDSYILETYDVDVLPFDGSTLVDMQHIFGRHPTHYETRYYNEKSYQLNDIIYRNEALGLDNEENQNIRRLMRNNQIQKMKIINQNYANEEKIKRLNKKIKKLSKKNDNLESDLDAVLNSNSWKLTQPLRSFKRKL